MNKLNLLFTAGVLSLAVASTSVYARDCDNPRHAERLAERLELSEVQADQVHSILSEQCQSMQALKEQTRDSLSAVLTADQLEAFEEMEKRRKHHRPFHKDKG